MAGYMILCWNLSSIVEIVSVVRVMLKHRLFKISNCIRLWIFMKKIDRFQQNCSDCSTEVVHLLVLLLNFTFQHVEDKVNIIEICRCVLKVLSYIYQSSFTSFSWLRHYLKLEALNHLYFSLILRWQSFMNATIVRSSCQSGMVHLTMTTWFIIGPRKIFWRYAS